MNPTLRHPCKHAPADDEHRCECGRLVARRVPGGVELRCGRCKKPIILLFEEDERGSAKPLVARPPAVRRS